MADNVVGPRAPVVVPPAAQPPQRPGVGPPAAAVDDAGAWQATGAAAPQRAAAQEPPAAPQSPADTATRDAVRDLNTQLTAANTNLATLKQQLQAAQQQLTGDQSHQGFRDRLRGGSPQVQQDNATVARLNGEIGTAQGNVTRLRGEIDKTVTAALTKDPGYQTRAKQLTTFTKADAATKAFLTQIDQTKSAISAAQSAQTANNVGDIAGALFGTTNDPLQQAAHATEEANKKAKLAIASAKVSTLGAQTDAWKAQIEAITTEQVSAPDAGALNARLGIALPLVREFISPAVADGLDGFNDISNAIALNKAAKNVDTLRQGVQGYDDEVGSKKRQLETTQNNALVALRTQLLQ